MTKQNKLFSWLGFGKKTEADTADSSAEQQIPVTESQPETLLPPAKEQVAAEVAEVKPEPATAAAIAPVSELQPQPAERPGFFARLKQGLTKTSQNLGNGLASLFLGKKIDEDLYEELETQ